MASIAGLTIWALVCGGVCLAASVYLVRRYSRPEVDWSIKATVVICWWMTFTVVFLIPLDLIPEARPATAVLWRIEFWGIQFLTWIWAGGQQDYFDAGDFTFKGTCCDVPVVAHWQAGIGDIRVLIELRKDAIFEITFSSIGWLAATLYHSFSSPLPVLFINVCLPAMLSEAAVFCHYQLEDCGNCRRHRYCVSHLRGCDKSHVVIRFGWVCGCVGQHYRFDTLDYAARYA
jgi:hypothetical protein